MDGQKNPCGLNGFAFLEFSGQDPKAIQQQFLKMGFTETALHKSECLSLYQQGEIQFVLNQSQNSQASQHAKQHGPGASAMGFCVANADKAYAYALQQGAVPFQDPYHDFPGIEAIGGSVIYFVDEKKQQLVKHWEKKTKAQAAQEDCGLLQIDHLTHNVHRGNMDKWADFYRDIFNFREIRFFDIKGKMTGLVSRALGSPCGKIKIPLNESKDDKSQIEEFLQAYQGEGIQHIALSTDNIYQTVQSLKAKGTDFLDVPDTYYEMINQRIPWHHEPVHHLQAGRILIDGEKTPEAGLLLQIFTQNVFGPVFFEIIQRQGNEGFGEGNFQALFEAIERDQMRRGTL